DLTNVAISATASSGLPVTLSLDPGSAASLGGTLTNGTGFLNNIQTNGTVTLRAVQAGDANYFSATNTVSMSVVKNQQSVISFSNIPTLTYSNGLTVPLNAQTDSGLPVVFSVISGPATLSSNILTVTGAGNVLVNATQPGNETYNPSARTLLQTLVVDKASNNISFNLSSLPALTYGDAPIDLKPYVSGVPAGLTPSFSVVVGGPATISNGILTLTGAGPVTVRAWVPNSDNYYSSPSVDQTIQVGKKALTITAVSTNRPAGQANPSFNVSYTGRLGSDVLQNPPVVNTLATASSPTGTYPLTPAGASSPNYNISYTPGTLTVTQTSVSSSGFSWSTSIDPIAYGTPLSGTQLNAVNPSVAGTITYSPAAGAVLPVGTHSVVATFTPSDTNSYSVTTITNTVIVTKASLVVTAEPKSKVAGQSDPVLTYQLAGTMAGSDTLSGTLGRTSGESRGTYPINLGTLAVSPSSSAGNYTIQFVSADFTITADSASVISSYDGTNTVPLVEDYEAISVTGVDAGNVAAINTAIAFLSSTATDSKDEVQAIVNAYGLILSESGEGLTDLNSAYNPTFLTYQTIGVNLGTLTTTYPTAIGLLNDIVRRQGAFGVDTLTEVQNLAGIVERLMITAAGGTPSPALTAADMTLIGLSGVTSSNLSTFLASVAATANDGTGIDTFTELQTLAQTQSGALAAISAAAQANNATDLEPSAGTYATAGVTGVTADNLASINSALNSAGVIGTSADTTAEVQAIVNAFNAILTAA
ncbi:MAG: hypothetical protein EBZ44_06115, partial [Verrucomicrobia bacterium]|nr:hypothetical protein [Verrucomicrobiota bacterium]